MELGYLAEDCGWLRYWDSELDEHLLLENKTEGTYVVIFVVGWSSRSDCCAVRKAWRILRPILEPRLIKIRDARLEKIDRPRRVKLIRTIGSQYKRPLIGRHCLLLPPVESLLRYLNFVESMDDCKSPDNLQAVAQSLDPLEEMAQRLLLWATKVRRMLLSIIPTAASSNSEIAVFHCNGCNTHTCFVSVDSAIIHLSRLHGAIKMLPIQFNTRGWAAIKALLEALKLDLATTTPLDLDRRDARLTCLCCPIGSFGKCIKGRDAMSWRDCV